MKRPIVAALGALIMLAVVACSHVNTTSSEVALQYGGGPFDSVKYVQCTEPGIHQARDPNDTEYYFPLGQRDFAIGTGAGEDSPALTSVTQDGQQVSVTGQIKFTLDTSCTDWPKNAPDNKTGRDWPGGKLQAFFELICRQQNCVSTDPNAELPAGWDVVLRNYVGAAVDFASDQETLKFGWQKLYSDATATQQWSADVQKQIPAVLNRLTLGTNIFTIDTVLLQKPGIQPQLQAGLANVQAAQLRQQAAAVDERAAKSFPGGVPGYQAYQEQQAVNQAIEQGKVKVIPIPTGSGIIINPNG